MKTLRWPATVKALNAALPADVRALVERQAQGAKRNHDEVRALRDSYAQR